jgi:hypothetical protein
MGEAGSPSKARVRSANPCISSAFKSICILCDYVDVVARRAAAFRDEMARAALKWTLAFSSVSHQYASTATKIRSELYHENHGVSVVLAPTRAQSEGSAACLKQALPPTNVNRGNGRYGRFYALRRIDEYLSSGFSYK